MMTEQRLIDLETRIAYQESHISELDKTIFKQQQTIELLNKKFIYLQQLIKDSNGSDRVETAQPEDEIPPHY